MTWLWIAAASAFPTHDDPHRAGATAPDDAAVVVGIEDYFALPDVPFATRDARAVQDLLIYTVGVPSDRVQLVTANASRERILDAVDDAAAQVGPGGTLWLYFAGHGAAAPETGERILLGIDTMADAGSFSARAVSIGSLKEAAGEVSRTVLMVDACYAGAGRDGAELLPGKRFAVPAFATAETPRWIEWNAAQASELSGPLELAEHGAFTWAVIGAMRGWADGQITGEPDGQITFEEADLYVQEVLRAVEVRDQRPAMQAADRSGALVQLPVDKLEPRPDNAALRAAVQAPPHEPEPAAPPPPPTDDAEAKGISHSATAQHWAGECTPNPVAPEGMTKIKEWAQDPGIDPRASWTCMGRGVWIYLNRFPPVADKPIAQLMVDNVALENTRVPGKVPKVHVRLPGSEGDKRSLMVSDPETWPARTLQTPRGELSARVAPFDRQRGVLAPGPYLVVEDDREPGALWVCRSPAQTFGKAVTACTGALEAALRDDHIEGGLVR